jgi:GxxExxY protein
MRCAYDSQNALGRLCDERVYEKDLARRLVASGLNSMYTQVPLVVRHGAFRKDYRLDLLADGALYELKTVASFIPEHDAQILNYSMLLAVNHGKQLNFRSERIQGRLRFNVIQPHHRQQVAFDEILWSPQSHQCETLLQRTKELVTDWGGFLDFRLYEEALIFGFGGPETATKRLPLKFEGTELGTHRFNSHSENVCFMVSTRGGCRDKS